jgi:hypothetical protein
MNHEKNWDEPSEVSAEQGEVIVDGPDGVAVSLTPDAALETSDRLLKSGLAARGQQLAEARSKGGAGALRKLGHRLINFIHILAAASLMRAR